MSQPKANASWKLALFCLCPRCGHGQLFTPVWYRLDFKTGCTHCSLDFRQADPGDGPAMFTILIMGLACVAGTVTTEIIWRPPQFANIGFWAGVAIGGSWWMIKRIKAFLFVEQYHHDLKPEGME